MLAVSRRKNQSLRGHVHLHSRDKKPHIFRTHLDVVASTSQAFYGVWLIGVRSCKIPGLLAH